ncbi:MAG TPA: HEAT repeat domain-containing protein [Gemmataceae bacterium]|nr:HEAT repeat domain-containing protein [Gemmataceae bacterium]
MAVWQIDRRSREAAPVLAAALTDENPSVREAAAAGLGGIGPPAKRAARALIALLKDEDASVRKAVADALKQIDPQAASKAGVR